VSASVVTVMSAIVVLPARWCGGVVVASLRDRLRWCLARVAADQDR
jgi:hypothetical protein